LGLKLNFFLGALPGEFPKFCFGHADLLFGDVLHLIDGLLSPTLMLEEGGTAFAVKQVGDGGGSGFVCVVHVYGLQNSPDWFQLGCYYFGIIHFVSYYKNHPILYYFSNRTVMGSARPHI